MLSPEAPYPLDGGGAWRTASLLHFFARFAEVDMILFSQSGHPAALPSGLVRTQCVIRLPYHGRGQVARYTRNAGRSIRGVPPLVDRFAGYSAAIERAVGGRQYDIGVVEHFWCAPYIDQLERFCTKTVLDLHNIESVLHGHCAQLGRNHGSQLIRMGHRRFAKAAQKLESTLLPRYSSVLTTSEEDARRVREIAPSARTHVYPNALPHVDLPICTEYPRVVFPANFEYHPNIDAVRFLVREIWPEVKKRHPDLRLRLVGRNEEFIRHLLPAGPSAEIGIELTGRVEDARAEIAQARIVVAPLRAGSGTRLKILEAWAAARCVIATPLAAEGLDARDGVNIAIEADAAAFAARISKLADDSADRAHLAAGGRRTFEDLYSWETVWENLNIDLQLTQASGLTGYTGSF
ncbi:MAG TPA: glycosyltransferase [Bryobacteraceae bacterium]|nr:glycosyltransferase [Bryobacteraceae bacterium]